MKVRKAPGTPFRRSSDGLWVAIIELPSYTTGRKRKTVTAKEWVDCIAKRDALLTEIARHGAPTDKTTSVARWVEYWLENIVKPTQSPRTYSNYRSCANANIVPILGDHRLVDLRAAHIREMNRVILAHGKTTRTAINAHSVLSVALRDAMRDEIIDRNVAKNVARVRDDADPRQPLTLAQAQLLVSTAVERHDPMAARIAAALALGARQGELLGLTWDRVDLDTGIVDLSWQLTAVPMRHGPKCVCGPKAQAARCPDAQYDVPRGYPFRAAYGRLAWTKPKTRRSIRLMPMPAPLTAMLAEHRITTWVPNRFDLVWADAGGFPISAADDLKVWKTALTAAGLPYVPLHNARHTTATLLLEAKVPMSVISEVLGHVGTITTEGYAHKDLSMRRAALDHLNGLMPVRDERPGGAIDEAPMLALD